MRASSAPTAEPRSSGLPREDRRGCVGTWHFARNLFCALENLLLILSAL